jgi:hypothetical protein
MGSGDGKLTSERVGKSSSGLGSRRSSADAAAMANEASSFNSKSSPEADDMWPSPEPVPPFAASFPSFGFLFAFGLPLAFAFLCRLGLRIRKSVGEKLEGIDGKCFIESCRIS